jgi:hypothetical protein
LFVFPCSNRCFKWFCAGWWKCWNGFHFFSHLHIIDSMHGNGSTMTYYCSGAQIWWHEKSYVNILMVRSGGEFSPQITFLFNSFQSVRAIIQSQGTSQMIHINTIYHKETVVMWWFFDHKHTFLSIENTSFMFCLLFHLMRHETSEMKVTTDGSHLHLETMISHIKLQIMKHSIQVTSQINHLYILRFFC